MFCWKLTSGLATKNCHLCRLPMTEYDRFLCSTCAHSLPFNKSKCLRCALPMQTSGLCHHCQSGNITLSFITSPYRYEFPIAQCINQFKHSAKLWHAKFLANQLTEALLQSGHPWPDLLIPVPTHRRRQWTRGFCHTTLLSRWISKQTGIPYDSSVITRKRFRKPQSLLSRAKRQQLNREDFTIRRHRALQGLHIAIIDDVATTCQTLKETAHSLLALNPKMISGLVVARTPHH